MGEDVSMTSRKGVYLNFTYLRMIICTYYMYICIQMRIPQSCIFVHTYVYSWKYIVVYNCTMYTMYLFTYEREQRFVTTCKFVHMYVRKCVCWHASFVYFMAKSERCQGEVDTRQYGAWDSLWSAHDSWTYRLNLCTQQFKCYMLLSHIRPLMCVCSLSLFWVCKFRQLLFDLQHKTMAYATQRINWNYRKRLRRRRWRNQRSYQLCLFLI